MNTSVTWRRRQLARPFSEDLDRTVVSRATALTNSVARRRECSAPKQVVKLTACEFDMVKQTVELPCLLHEVDARAIRVENTLQPQQAQQAIDAGWRLDPPEGPCRHLVNAARPDGINVSQGFIPSETICERRRGGQDDGW